MNRRVVVLALGTFAIGTDGFVVAGVLPQVTRGLGESLARGGTLVTAFALVYGLMALPLTVALARVPRRRLLVSAMLGLAAANAAAAAATSFRALLAFRALAAVAAAAYSPAALAAAVQVSEPDRRGRAVAVVLAGMTLSLVVGVPLGSLLGDLGTWRWTFALVAALAAAAAAGVAVLLPEVPATAPVPLRARLRLLGRPAVAANLAAPVLWLTGAFAVYTYVAAVTVRATGWPASAVSGMLLVYGAAAFAGNLLGGRATDRFGGDRTVVWALAVTGASFAALGWAAAHPGGPGRAVALMALAGWGLAGWALTPAQSQRLLRAAPDAGPEVLSLNTAAIYLGIAAGSAVGGRVLAAHGLPSLGYAGAALQAVALGTVLAAGASRARAVRAGPVAAID